MTAFFAYAAAVQTNDPDAVRWMAIYGAACAISIGSALGRSVVLPGFLVGGVAAVWGAGLALSVIGRQPLLDSEEGREMLGLVIVASAMGVLGASARLRGDSGSLSRRGSEAGPRARAGRRADP